MLEQPGADPRRGIVGGVPEPVAFDVEQRLDKVEKGRTLDAG